VLTQKYFEGKVPNMGPLEDYDREVMAEMAGFPERIARSIDLYRFREALNELMNLARLGNKYLTDTEPWKVFKTNPEKVRTTLNISLQICANLSVLCEPFLPFSAEKLTQMLNITPLKWADAGSASLIPGGHSLNQPGLLFEKIEDAAIETQIQKLLDTRKSNEAANAIARPAKDVIEFDDFGKVDLRTGTIIAAEKVAKTKKLLKLTVDTGIDKRTVVSGIAEYYEPENIIGQQVAILVNLAPRNLKGIESQGMILMAEDHDGKLCFIAPTSLMKNGSEIR